MQNLNPVPLVLYSLCKISTDRKPTRKAGVAGVSILTCSTIPLLKFILHRGTSDMAHWVAIYRQGGNSLSIVGRLTTLFRGSFRF